MTNEMVHGGEGGDTACFIVQGIVTIFIKSGIIANYTKSKKFTSLQSQALMPDFAPLGHGTSA
jgi:hypothetical protein